MLSAEGSEEKSLETSLLPLLFPHPPSSHMDTAGPVTHTSHQHLLFTEDIHCSVAAPNLLGQEQSEGTRN